jgi:hypothetical protein
MTAGALPLSSPPAERLEAWRAAVLAYRRVMRTTGDDWCGRVEAIEAYLKVRPEDGPDEAERQVTRAICYAAAHHTDWFWRGVRYRPRAPHTS